MLPSELVSKRWHGSNSSRSLPSQLCRLQTEAMLASDLLQARPFKEAITNSF
jgi:hypothetical protein